MKQYLQKLFILSLTFGILAFLPNALNAQCAAGQVAVPFAFTGASQAFIVPAAVNNITITAVGGDGGTGSIGTTLGGSGASVTGTFPVTPGNSIIIVVGGAGGNNTNIPADFGGGGGGGGGTAVVNNTSATLLVVAGAGGGSSGIAGQGGRATAGGAGGGAAGAGADGSFHGTGGGGSLNAAGGTALANSNANGPGGATGGQGGGGALGAAGGLHAIAAGENGGGDGAYGAGGGGGGGDADGDGTGNLGGGGGGGGGGFTGGAGSPIDGFSGGNGGGSTFDGSASAPAITAGVDGGASATPANGSVLFCYFISAPLAVEFLDFTIAKADIGVQLNWKTGNEKDNDRFEVMHSIDGVDFTQVGTVQPKDAQKPTHDYAFQHENVINGINYYRIKQVDIDGQITYSDIQSMLLDNGKNVTVSINPRVTSTAATATVMAQKTAVSQVTVTDMKGQVVDQFNWNLKPGQQTFEINVRDWAVGMHLVVVRNGNNKQVFKIIKK